MKSIARIGLSLLSLMLCLIHTGHAEAEDTAKKAEDFFRQKQYKEARDLWQQMIREGNTSAGVYYNTGLAESMLNNVPEAILAFEKGLRLHPGNTLIKSAIKAERKKIENATIPVEPFFLQEWYRRMLTFLRPGHWAFTGLGLLLAGMIYFLVMIRRKPEGFQVNDKLFIVLAALGLVAILLGGLSYREIYREDEAIVSMPCEIRQAPTPESPVVREIAPGEKVTITDQIGEWYNVNLLNLDAGWVNNKNIIPIRIGKE